jgi:hypothetical protein
LLTGLYRIVLDANFSMHYHVFVWHCMFLHGIGFRWFGHCTAKQRRAKQSNVIEGRDGVCGGGAVPCKSAGAMECSASWRGAMQCGASRRLAIQCEVEEVSARQCEAGMELQGKAEQLSVMQFIAKQQREMQCKAAEGPALQSSGGPCIAKHGRAWTECKVAEDRAIQSRPRSRRAHDRSPDRGP